MYVIHEIKHDENYIVTAVAFTKSLSETVTCNVMFELLPGPNGFIPYEDLTEETVITWLEEHVDMPNVDMVLEKTQKQQNWISATQFPWG